MIEIKQNTAVRVPVRLFSAAGTAVNAAAHTDLTVTVWKADGTTATLTPGASDWAQVTAGAFVATGTYTLLLPTSATDVAGPLMYAVDTVASEPYIGSVKVVANEEADSLAAIAGVTTAINAMSAYAVSFTAGGDTVSPTITRVATQGRTALRVDFSEPVVMTTGANGALNASNYTLVGGTVLAVQQVQGVSNAVLLTTSATTPGVQYTLRIENIEDLYGNPII